MKHIEVENAIYIDGYRVSIFFNDGKKQIVDFADFITHNNKEALNKYKNLDQFRKFKVTDGNVVWGKNWDLIFPVSQLYKGTIQ